MSLAQLSIANVIVVSINGTVRCGCKKLENLVVTTDVGFRLEKHSKPGKSTTWNFSNTKLVDIASNHFTQRLLELIDPPVLLSQSICEEMTDI